MLENPILMTTDASLDSKHVFTDLPQNLAGSVWGITKLCCPSYPQNLTPTPLKMQCKRSCKWTLVRPVVLAFSLRLPDPVVNVEFSVDKRGTWLWETASEIHYHRRYFVSLASRLNAWLAGSLESPRSRPARWRSAGNSAQKSALKDAA